VALRRYVRLARDIWGCPKLRKLPLLARIVYVYLLDFPHETLTGIVLWDMDEFHYHFPYPEWNDAAVEKALAVLEQAGHIARDNGCIWLKQYTSEQCFRGDNIARGISAELERMSPKCGRLVLAYSEVYPFKQLKGASYRKGTGTGTGKVKSTDSKKNPTPKSKRLRPALKPLSELESELNPDCAIAWQNFKAMVASHNSTGTVADTRLAAMLDRMITAACAEQLSNEQMNHGLHAAITASGGKGAPNTNYVLAAARGYEERA